jgi:cellulose biosynthesis protein BcsQ
MAKLIAVLGEKGGTGKSTVAHLVGHGAGSLPHAIDAAVVTTDPGDVVVTGARRYLPVDGREPAALASTLAGLDQHERLLIVLDGAAARPHVDDLAAELADLILLPFGPSYQDAARTLRDLERLPQAVALPNRWPTHPAVAERAGRFLEMIPAARQLPALQALPRVDELLDADAYGRIATALSKPSQRLVLEILHRMGVHPLDLAAR